MSSPFYSEFSRDHVGEYYTRITEFRILKLSQPGKR